MSKGPYTGMPVPDWYKQQMMQNEMNNYGRNYLDTYLHLQSPIRYFFITGDKYDAITGKKVI